jgi:hypothetical protein
MTEMELDKITEKHKSFIKNHPVYLRSSPVN